LKHGKFTYKEISIMSTEAEIGLLIALLAKASGKGNLDPPKGEKKEVISRLYQEMHEVGRLGTAVKCVM
jgi:hypothetical protein